MLAVGIRQLRKHATVEDFRRKLSRDFAVALSASKRAYVFSDALDTTCEAAQEIPTMAIEKLHNANEFSGDIDDFDDAQMRIIEAEGAVGTLQGVPFFAAPQGKDLAKAMLPFIEEAIAK